MTERPLRARLEAALLAPADPAGLAAFRVAIGLIGLVSAARFFRYGWIDELFVRPRVFFHYWGFEWVRPLPGAGMYWVFGGLAVVSACVALGLLYRVTSVLFCLGFVYVQLLDVTNYLNHYYLVALLTGLIALMPLHGAGSIDALLFPSVRRASVPMGLYHLFRFQVGVVYFFAGLAKVQTDWLLHAQPLQIWLSSRTGLPIVGPLLAHPLAPWLFAWGGCLYDLTIPFWLSWPRSRPFAYAAVVGFHATVGLLFPIGMFPWIMTLAALAFFSPTWPRDLLARVRLAARAETAPPPVPRPRWMGAALVAGGAWCAAQLLLPLRAHLYGRDVIWHEQGMRWSWRVMLREKNGSVTYRVTDPRSGRTWEASPSRWLTDRQERDFSSQPDLILQLAHHVAREAEARVGGPVEVRADAFVSLNGRPAARLVDPTVDLARIEDGVGKASWILPPPSAPPPHLRALSRCDRRRSPSSC